MQLCHGRFRAMQKRPKKCRLASAFSSSHFLFPRDFLGTAADTDIVNAPLEQLRPANVPFWGHVTETKDRDEFLPKNRFLAAVAPPCE